MARIVGARGDRAPRPRGRLIGAYGAPAEMLDARTRRGDELVRVEIPSELVVWTSPYAPFFGGEELALLRTLGGPHRARARPRAPVRPRARDARSARAARRGEGELRRARRARAADAGRERSTGSSETLHARGDELDAEPARAARADAPRAERAPHGRARRAAARPVAPRRRRGRRSDPQRSRSAPRVEELVHRGRRARAPTSQVDVARDLEAARRPDGARPDRLQPRRQRAAATAQAPVIVARREARPPLPRSPSRTAARACRPSSCPTCSSASPAASEPQRARRGTGLGLAIARSYAQAHRGDLFYEPAHRTARASSSCCRRQRPRDDVRAQRLRIASRHGSAGERTRTSKGFRPTGPKPVASTSSATPARCNQRLAPKPRRRCRLRRRRPTDAQGNGARKS